MGPDSSALCEVSGTPGPTHLFRVVPPQCLGELEMLSQMPRMFPSHHYLKGIQQEQWKHIWGVNLIVLKIGLFQNWELPVFILGFFGHPFFFKLNRLKTKMTLHFWIQIVFINTKASVLWLFLKPFQKVPSFLVALFLSRFVCAIILLPMTLKPFL